MKLTRSRILAATVFLCLLGGALDIYAPVLPKQAGHVLRAIEDKTALPVTEWAEAITGRRVAASGPADTSGKAGARGLVDAAMDKMLEQKEVEKAAQALTTLKHIQFEGVTILGDMELRGIVEPFLNSPMTYEQMLEIGMVVEQYYRKNNYLARAVLPPQDLTDGVLTVDVIESVFSKVEIEQELADLPNTQAHVEALIQAHQPIGEPLNNKSLDRALALANDLPGMSALGSLRQGREAGETELLLKLYQGRTRQTELTMDNSGSRAAGAMRWMANLAWFNPNNLGDLLNVVAAYTKGSDYARLTYSIPLGTDGWRMGANASIMNYKVVVGQQGIVDAVGRALTKGLEWAYPLLRGDESSATVTLMADAKKFENIAIQGLLISDYQARAMSAQVSGFYRDLNPSDDKGTFALQLPNSSFNSDGSLSQQTDLSAQLIQLELRHQLESGFIFATSYDWGQVWLQSNPNFPGDPNNNSHIYKGLGASMGDTIDNHCPWLASDRLNFKIT